MPARKLHVFLNRNGGTILLGVNDNKELNGIDPEKADFLCKDLASLSNNSNKIDPVFLLHPTVIDFSGKKMIHVFVPASSQVHKTNGKIFDRSADGDFQLKTDGQISLIYQRKSVFYSETTIYPFLSENDFDTASLSKVRKLIRMNRPDHPWNGLSDQEFFRVSGLFNHDIRSGKEGFTMATLLLLGKDQVIQSALPHYKIDALVRRMDLDRYDDRENIRCNLVEAYDKLMGFISKHLPDKFYMQGDQRISLREKFFREIVANILIHREYTNAYPTSLVIYKDRVESKNANRPHVFGQLLPESFEPFPKNPHLAQIFTQMGRSEELGTGLRNVYKYIKAYSGSDDILFLEEDVFKITIPLEETSPSLKGVTKDVTKKNREMEILNLIKLNPFITTGEIASQIKLTQRTVLREIASLKKENKIKRVGGRKTGYWELA